MPRGEGRDGRSLRDDAGRKKQASFKTTSFAKFTLGGMQGFFTSFDFAQGQQAEWNRSLKVTLKGSR
ncbi:MAG: hypothetical protein DMG22_13365 [Acidobacteria bacterium]|nr:MAG: hypothetical protein DMG22_13365 [Acidobacteriota bacterium]